MPTAVTVVEWGTGLAEGLADSRLEVDIGGPPYPLPPARTDRATTTVRCSSAGIGERWTGADLASLRQLHVV